MPRIFYGLDGISHQSLRDQKQKFVFGNIHTNYVAYNAFVYGQGYSWYYESLDYLGGGLAEPDSKNRYSRTKFSVECNCQFGQVLWT